MAKGEVGLGLEGKGLRGCVLYHCDGVNTANLAIGDAERLRENGPGDSGRDFLGTGCGSSLGLITSVGVGVGWGRCATDSSCSSCSIGLFPLQSTRCIRIHSDIRRMWALQVGNRMRLEFTGAWGLVHLLCR